MKRALGAERDGKRAALGGRGAASDNDVAHAVTRLERSPTAPIARSLTDAGSGPRTITPHARHARARRALADSTVGQRSR